MVEFLPGKTTSRTMSAGCFVGRRTRTFRSRACTPLYERGTANGLAGLRILNPKQMREDRTARWRGIAALHVPQEGIVDYSKSLRDAGRATSTGKSSPMQRSPRYAASAVNGSPIRPLANIAAMVLVNCTGLFADRTAQLAGETRVTRIVPVSAASITA